MKQKITMKVVEDFVAKHPNGKNLKGADGSYTYFNKGEDQTGDFENPNEVRPGCLFGHIVKALGGGPKLVVENRTIEAQDEILSRRLTRTEEAILTSAQRRADNGETWSAALAGAKRNVHLQRVSGDSGL